MNNIIEYDEEIQVDKEKAKIDRNQVSYLIIAFTQGITTLADIAIQYFYKDFLLLQPAEMARIISLTMIPWICKPLLGLLTDLVPIFGYRRKIYISMCGLLSVISWLYLSCLATGLFETTFFLFLYNIAIAFASVVGEAIVVELSKHDTKSRRVSRSSVENNQTVSTKAKNYVSLFFLYRNIGVLISSFFKGFLIDVLSVRGVFFSNAIASSLLLIAGFIMVEERVTKRNSVTIDSKTETLLDHMETIKRQNSVQTKIQLFKEFLIFLKKKEAWIPLLFVIILFAMPNFSDVFFFFMTNALLFTPTQLGFISLMSTMGVLLAIYSYRNCFKHWSFKIIVSFSSVLYFIFAFVALIIVLNYRNPWFNSFLLCMCGFTFLSVIAEISMMPMMTLACSICPPKLEGTVYACFMSALSLGVILSSLNGSFIVSFYNVTSQNFDNLEQVIIFSNVCKLIPLVFLYFIPSRFFEPSIEHKIPSEFLQLTKTDDINELNSETEEQALGINNPNENVKKIIM
jgi:hypothetical protein